MPRAPQQTRSSLDLVKLARCCAEAQADGVPCPTLGRDCEVCARAMRDADFEPPATTIRPIGRD